MNRKKILKKQITLLTCRIPSMSFFYVALCLILALVCIQPVSAENEHIYISGKTISVGPGCEYESIQEALDAANEGDTIFVNPKFVKNSPIPYYENIVINKSNIKIEGKNKNTTIVDGANAGNTVTFRKVKNVIISNLTIQGGATGIVISNSDNNKIELCHVTKNLNSGIAFNSIRNNGFTGQSIDNEIHQCEIIENSEAGINLGEGRESENSTIRKCTIKSNSKGITGWTGNKGIKIIENEIVSNRSYGIYSTSGIDWTIEKNKIHLNGENSYDHGGIYIRSPSNNYITSNYDISQNDISFNNGHGIYIDSTYSGSKPLIRYNKFEENTFTGISLLSTSNNTISHNKFYKNKLGVFCNSKSSYNFIFFNNFIENIENHAEDNGKNNVWDDRQKNGNYWSEFQGVDEDGDGIGDLGYVVYGTAKAVDEFPSLKTLFIKPFILGDVNGDGDVNSTDMALIRRYILGIIDEFPGSHGVKPADLNGDGNINSTDVVLIKRFILGIIDLSQDS